MNAIVLEATKHVVLTNYLHFQTLNIYKKHNYFLLLHTY